MQERGGKGLKGEMRHCGLLGAVLPRLSQRCSSPQHAATGEGGFFCHL